MPEMLDTPWALSPSVALRPEPFGALAYHFTNRQLTFLKRPQLVALIQELGNYADVRSALLGLSIPRGDWSTYVTALTRLAETDMICPRDTTEGSPA